MKKLFPLLLTLLTVCNLQAQVPNDDCATATDIGVMDGTYNFLSYDFSLFDTCIDVSTLQATVSYPYYSTDSTCNNTFGKQIGKDVWFKFVSTPAFTIRGIQSQNVISPIDSVSITFWEGNTCNQMRPLGNYKYVIKPGSPVFYDTIWANNTNVSDTFFAQISGITYTSLLQLYLCFRGISDTVPPIAGCYFTNANIDTICFKYVKHRLPANWGNTGSAAIEIQSGLAPFTFLWSDGNTDSARTNLAAGKYHVTITDAGGCTQMDSVEVVSECSASCKSTNVGPGYYNFSALGTDTIQLKNFVWTVNSDTIIQDSVAGSVFYRFTANGNYSVCVHISDSTSQCAYDTCLQLSITDGTYVPLLDSVNVWHYVSNLMPVLGNPGNNNSRSSNCGPGSSNSGNGFTEYTGNDTMIDSYTYKILWSQTLNMWPVQQCVMGYLREDTIMRRIYFWDIDSAHETLLYDFGMGIGDTVTLRFSNSFSYYQTGVYKLDSIGSFNAQHTASPRKVFYLKKGAGVNQVQLKWVEGIGNMAELIYPYNRFSPWSSGMFPCPEYESPGTDQVLVCYEHKQLDFYDACALGYVINNWCFNYLDTCNYYLICGGIQEVSSVASLEVFPNPAQKEINLKLEVKKADDFFIQVTDLQGRSISPTYNLGKLGEGTHTQQVILPVAHQGLYFIQCHTSEGSIYKKILLE